MPVKNKSIKRVRFSKQKGRKQTRRSKKIVLTPKPILLNGAPKEVKMEELNLDAMPKMNKKTVVMGVIYAKWCPHCKDLIPDEDDMDTQPKWQQTIDMIKGMQNRDRDMYYIKLEDDEIRNQGKLDKLNNGCKGICRTPVTANGYPTVFRMSGGNLEIYDGVRQPDAMAEWFTRGNQDSPLPPPIGK
jgi:thiol-disulfide isomerase/thioredoxin